MAKVDQTYHQLASHIIDNGNIYEDASRKINCLQTSAATLNLSIKDEFPLITTKKMYTKAIVAELIWFLTGSTNIKYLVDNSVNIWNKDAYNWYLKKSADLEKMDLEEFIQTIKNTTEFRPDHKGYTLGDVGKNYGYQWTNWNGEINQIENMLEVLTSPHPIKRRQVVTAWNPTEVSETALPPCHWSWEIIPTKFKKIDKINYFSGVEKEHWESLWQASLGKDKELALEADEILTGYFERRNIPEYGFTLKWHQRSVDTFLGLPFNIASYGILAKIIEAMTGLYAINIIGDLSNVHFYEPHIETVREQLGRDVNQYQGCKLEFSEKFSNLADDFRDKKISYKEFVNSLEIEDFIFAGYKSYPKLNASMFAPMNSK